MRKIYLIGGLVGVLGLAGFFAWQQRASLQAWYYVQKLAAAQPEDRGPWVERLAALDRAAVPRLIGCLERGDDRVCDNAQAVLLRMLEQKPAPADRAALATQLAGAFPRLNGPGQFAVLDLGPRLLPAPPEVLRALLATLGQASQSPLPEVRRRGLELMTTLLNPAAPAEVRDVAREVIRASLRGSDPAERLLAVSLAVQPELNLLEQVTPLLHDTDLEVRRKAVAVVSTSAEAIRTDELLRWLHDADPEVRQLCEAALVFRGLTPEQIRRGRLLTDPRPEVRLQILVGLEDAADLDPAVWLRHLSHDAEPAVRVAAVRAAAEMPRVDLTDRLEQMVQDDPSDTVRQVSRYYLAYPKPRSDK